MSPRNPFGIEDPQPGECLHFLVVISDSWNLLEGNNLKYEKKEDLGTKIQALFPFILEENWKQQMDIHKWIHVDNTVLNLQADKTKIR